MYDSNDSYSLVTVDKSIFVDCKVTLVALKRFKIGVHKHIIKAKSNESSLFNIEEASLRVSCF